MVTRALTLESPAGSISLESAEFAALQGGSGFGRPPVSVRWWEGAGDGSVYQSTRVMRRVIPLPLLLRAPDADTLGERLSLLMQIIDPDAAPARLTMDTGTDQWWVDVVCTSGGDWVWGKDTNGSSWVALTLTLEAGAPFWTRRDAAVLPITPGGLGRGLLGTGRSLSMLRLSSGQAIGDVILENPGDVHAAPVVTITGPATSLTSANYKGETLTWSGVLAEGEQRVIDHRNGTIVDPAHIGDPDLGNRYDELGTAPRFWSIPRGLTTATFELLGVTVASSIVVRWQPRRWVVI